MGKNYNKFKLCSLVNFLKKFFQLLFTKLSVIKNLFIIYFIVLENSLHIFLLCKRLQYNNEVLLQKHMHLLSPLG